MKGLERYEKILKGEELPKFKMLNAEKFKEKIREAYRILSSCELCERKCGINRTSGEKGFCGAGNAAQISSAFPHMGEERFFIPSFTIFFMGCTFKCQYCQNWEISQWYERGREVTPEEIANMIDRCGCINVNFVGGEPTPYIPFILEALSLVTSNIPVIWNSNFYMSEKAMKLLSGVVDVYLSDWKYGNNECAFRLSKVKKYWEVVSRNHELAFKDAELVIRHLILPNHVECCSKPILEHISKKYGDRVVVNLMPQYRPEWKAKDYEEINRLPTREELNYVWELADSLGLNWIK
ncbi:MAG TPA: radical SAM protein [Candidatus Aenigmarchaeota archaeon]|nr:radical SAM protein [Candidatus Aenigmarchaeota archaeon]